MSDDTGPRMDDWATHLPALTAALAATSGAVLECGAGIWSTPILRAICAPRQRHLVTMEANAEWLEKFADLASDRHAMVNVADWSDVAAIERTFTPWPFTRWSVAFVDHGHAPRGPVVAALRDRADLVVMHDSECHYCGYGEALASFDWCWTHEHSPTWTTIAGMGKRPDWIEGALSPGRWGVPACYRG